MPFIVFKSSFTSASISFAVTFNFRFTISCPVRVLGGVAGLEAQDPANDPICQLPMIVLQLLNTLIDAAKLGRGDYVSALVQLELPFSHSYKYPSLSSLLPP